MDKPIPLPEVVSFSMDFEPDPAGISRLLADQQPQFLSFVPPRGLWVYEGYVKSMQSQFPVGFEGDKALSVTFEWVGPPRRRLIKLRELWQRWVAWWQYKKED